MAYRPATQLKNDLKSWLDAATKNDESAIIPIDNLKAWYSLAEKIDARMRLDGSKRNKRKAKK